MTDGEYRWVKQYLIQQVFDLENRNIVLAGVNVDIDVLKASRLRMMLRVVAVLSKSTTPAGISVGSPFHINVVKKIGHSIGYGKKETVHSRDVWKRYYIKTTLTERIRELRQTRELLELMA